MTRLSRREFVERPAAAAGAGLLAPLVQTQALPTRPFGRPGVPRAQGFATAGCWIPEPRAGE